MKNALALAAIFLILPGTPSSAQKINTIPNLCMQVPELDVVESISGNTDEIETSDFTKIDALSFNGSYERIMAVSDEGKEVWLDVHTPANVRSYPRYFRRSDLNGNFTEVTFPNMAATNGVFTEAMMAVFADHRMQAAWFVGSDKLYMVGDSKLFLFDRAGGKRYQSVTVMDFPSWLDDNVGGLTFNPAGDHFYLFQQRDASCKLYFHYQLDGNTILNAEPLQLKIKILANPGSITRAGNHFLLILQDAVGGNMAILKDRNGSHTYDIVASSRSMPSGIYVTGPAFYDGDRKMMVTMSDPSAGAGEVSVYWIDTRSLSSEEDIYPTENQIRFYPNPADDNICILQESESNIVVVRIYSATGALMGEYPWQGQALQNCIQVDRYPSGIYILKALKKDGKIGVGRMVK